MITLFTYGPSYGLPDASPFVMKAELLLKLSKLPYVAKPGDPRKAPHKKLPYIEDDGQVICDSTLIRYHLEQKHGCDFDKELSPAQRGTAWALEKMLEDHLYWVLLQERWLDDRNFARGPAQLFRGVPAPLRGLITRMVRREIKKRFEGHGLGLHSRERVLELGARDLRALSEILGDQPYVLGARPCSADAAAFAFVAQMLCKNDETPIRASAESHANLVAYRDRMMAEFYPESKGANGGLEPPSALSASPTLH